jgi:hypothetical protein
VARPGGGSRWPEAAHGSEAQRREAVAAAGDLARAG